MIHVKKSVKYYINERALTFSENDLDDPQRVAVSLVSGTVIMVREPGIIDYASDGNFERWTLKGYSTKLVNNALHYVYARLSRTDRTALIVFSVKDYNIDGSITTAGEGGGATTITEPSTDYFYIKIGELTATDGKSDRELTYDSGLLGTEQGNEESSPLNEMWELDKYSTPWLIRAKQWLADFTVKGFITLVGGLVFRKGDTEKPVTDIKRSVDSDEDVPVSDENLATSKYVESQLEDLDDRFLSKVKPDETPHHIKLLGGLTTTEAASDDYAKDTLKAGWAARKDDDGNWYVEADKIVARILANVYDLLVENNAVFKGSLSSEEFISGFVGGKGWAIRMKEWLNAAGATEVKSVAEFDDLIVRGSMRVYEFIVSQMLGENDNRIFTGMMEVDHYDASDGKVYLKTDGGKLYNPFRVDDVIIVQQYGGMPSQDSGYYVTKQYEFIVTEVGIGSLSDGEGRLDWVRFRSFTTSMEGGDESLITERDTLVRIDNLSDARRKGIVQIMSVGEDTPYMDFVYGAKTDPEDSLKGRLGNIGGVYNPLFGWLKEFGAYLTNLYAVGEFRIAHTGDDVADAIEMAKGSFRTNYRQTTYDMTEEDNFLTNASFTDDCDGWILGEDSVEYFLVDGLPQYFNYELYASEKTAAVIASYKDRDMLRLFSSSARQSNDLIRKPGTHKEYSGEDEVVEVVDKLYLNVRFYCHADGDFSVGFADSAGTFYDNDFHSTGTYKAGVDAYTLSLSGTWDSTGDFYMKSTGDIYVDSVSLTDNPLDNYKIETSTRIEQDATKIALLGQRISGAENSITNLGIELNAAEERITAYVDKEIDGVEASVSQLQVDVEGISTRVATAQGAADNAKKAADAAQKAADDAAADALAAQDTADSASSKADANATAISQTSQSISAISAAFQKDANGNLVLTSAAGAVITSDMAKIYATKDGVSAELATKVTYDPATGAVTSKILLTADQINLKGSVTFDMFNSDLQTTVNSKVTQSDIDKSISNLNLGDLAFLSTVEKAKLGTTIIEGGYIKSELLHVTEIYATKGTVGGFTIGETSLTNTSAGSVSSGANIIITNESKDRYACLYGGDQPYAAEFRNDNGSAVLIEAFGDSSNVGLEINGNGNSKSIWSTGTCVFATRTSEAEHTYISGLSVSVQDGISWSRTSTDDRFSAGNTVDFLIATGDTTLPDASHNKGRVLFVKGMGSGSVTAINVYQSDGTYKASITWSDNSSRFFVSDGIYWFEFLCS